MLRNAEKSLDTLRNAAYYKIVLHNAVNEALEVRVLRIDRIKLITEMARQDMTQLRLVELSGVSRATISGIQNGRSCSSRSAVKIADALKVPLETLLEN